MSNYTLGPWEAGVKPCIVPLTGEGENFSGGDWNVFPPLGESGPVAIANTEENAHLIAETPNLLKALQSLCYEIDQIYDVDDGAANIPGDIMVEYEKACAAIKKATHE